MRRAVTALSLASIVFIGVIQSHAALKDDDGTVTEETTYGMKFELDDTVVKTKDGLHFNVPTDLPIKKKHGIVSPMSLDEYIALKFDEIDARIAALEKRIEAAENAFASAESVSRKESLSSAVSSQAIDGLGGRVDTIEVTLDRVKEIAQDKRIPGDTEERITKIEEQLGAIAAVVEKLEKGSQSKEVLDTGDFIEGDEYSATQN